MPLRLYLSLWQSEIDKSGISMLLRRREKVEDIQPLCLFMIVCVICRGYNGEEQKKVFSEKGDCLFSAIWKRYRSRRSNNDE